MWDIDEIFNCFKKMSNAVHKKDECELNVDIQCTSCGKLMALSNAVQIKNTTGGIEYLCPNGCNVAEPHKMKGEKGYAR